MLLTSFPWHQHVQWQSLCVFREQIMVMEGSSKQEIIGKFHLQMPDSKISKFVFNWLLLCISEVCSCWLCVNRQTEFISEGAWGWRHWRLLLTGSLLWVKNATVFQTGLLSLTEQMSSNTCETFDVSLFLFALTPISVMIILDNIVVIFVGVKWKSSWINDHQ